MIIKPQPIGFRGQYSATVIKADGTIKENLNEKGTLKSGQPIKNRLLDNFFQNLISQMSPIRNTTVRCGTGSTAVNDTQTGLANVLTLNSGNWPRSAPSSTSSFVENSILKAHNTYTYTFNQGQLSGNISELGVNFDNDTTLNVVHSRALVVDAQGDPTTISVGVDEQLILTYELFMEASIDPVVHTVDMLVDGVVTPVEITSIYGVSQNLSSYTSSRLGGNTSFRYYAASNGQLGPGGSLPTGSNIQNSTPPSFAYNISGGKETTLNLSISQGNVSGGIIAIVNISPTFKFGFNPPLPKNADRTMSITFRQTFGRLPE